MGGFKRLIYGFLLHPLGFLKSLFSNKALAEDIIWANETTYWKVRQELPNEDEHFYLATTLYRRFTARIEYTGKDPLNNPELEPFYASLGSNKLSSEAKETSRSIFSYTETRLFSVLDPPNSIRALALYVVYKELPSEAHRYAKEFNRIMEPIQKMEEDATFWGLYRKKNPNIAKRFLKYDKKNKVHYFRIDK